jgi:thioesterase domain-containing protein/aryl carrier-like protein
VYMVPAAYVRLETLPLTPTGKLDRHALPAPEDQAYLRRGYEPPVGETETLLARIWANALKLERVGRNDNFFELGGHSLLVANLVSKHRQIGIAISVADFFTHPTIESLVAFVQSRDADSLTKSGVIPLRIGGAEPPLFLAPDIFGQTFYGARLAQHLAPGFPVYGLAPPRPSEKPLRTIQAMAARMVRIIRAVQPDGPYRLAGWSFGAILAYEIATQLIGDDAPVEFLGSFDGYYLQPGIRGLEEIPSEDKALLRLMYEESAWTSPHPGTMTDENPSFEALAQACQERLLIPAELSADEIGKYLNHYRGNLLAMSAYIAHPIAIPLHFFAAEDLEYGAGVDSSSGWETVLPAEQIRSISVPGNHYSMMESPQIASLGEALSLSLSQAREGLIPQPEKDYCPLVAIRRARRGSIPVLCVPGAGGTAFSFTDLADGLRGIDPIEGLQPRGFDGTMVPHTTVQAAARTYVRHIEEKYPDGPVRLLGHSFGGWVAFEIAQLLRIRGRAVASLTILDSKPPHSNGAIEREYSRTEALMQLIELCEQAVQRSFNLCADQFDALDPRGQLDLLFERMKEAGLMPRQSRSSDLIGMTRTFETALRTHYYPENVYPDTVWLALAHDPKKDLQANEKSFESVVTGWRRWAPDLAIWRSSGNHMTMLRQPHVTELSNWLLSKMSPAES